AGDAEARAESSDCLVVQAVDPNVAGPEEACETRRRFNAEGLQRQHRAPVRRLLALWPQVLEQATAKADVQQLRTPTDAEQREVAFKRIGDDRGLERVALAVVARFDLRLGRIQHGVDVMA